MIMCILFFSLVRSRELKNHFNTGTRERKGTPSPVFDFRFFSKPHSKTTSPFFTSTTDSKVCLVVPGGAVMSVRASKSSLVTVIVNVTYRSEEHTSELQSQFHLV